MQAPRRRQPAGNGAPLYQQEATLIKQHIHVILSRHILHEIEPSAARCAGLGWKPGGGEGDDIIPCRLPFGARAEASAPDIEMAFTEIANFH